MPCLLDNEVFHPNTVAACAQGSDAVHVLLDEMEGGCSKADIPPFLGYTAEAAGSDADSEDENDSANGPPARRWGGGIRRGLLNVGWVSPSVDSGGEI